MTASGITTSNDDVKLTVLAGGLTIGAAADAGADDITLGSGNLTLKDRKPVTQSRGDVILASGLQLLGSGTVTLNDTGNNVSTLAATYNGPIAYTDSNTMTIGTVTDGPSGMTASGITTSHDGVKLTVLAGGLGLGAAADAGADDITLGSRNMTLNVVGNITQISGNVILASGLQLLGSGTVTLNDTGNNVSTLAATYTGPISSPSLRAALPISVTDGPSGMTASGITTSHDDVKLTVLAGGLGLGAAADAGADDITLGSGNLTLNVVGNIDRNSVV